LQTATISNAAGILFSESMSEPRGFFAYFSGCNVKDELRLVVRGPPSGRRFWPLSSGIVLSQAAIKLHVLFTFCYEGRSENNASYLFPWKLQ